MRILITDGSARTALATARSLVAAGHVVHVAGPHRLSLACVSRGVYSHVIKADPVREPDAFFRETAALAGARGVDVVLPVTDGSVEALLERRASLRRPIRLPFPSLESYRRATNKALAAEAAARAGFVVAPMSVLRCPADLDAVPTGLFPAVLRPTVALVAADGGRRKVTAAVVEDRGQARRLVDAAPADAFPFLLQQRIWGAGEGIFALRWNGRLVAAFAHRRLREKPPWGGVSVYRESVALTPEAWEGAERLLAQLDWQGVAMIECKRDQDTGRLAFVEINGRLWGSLQLAIDAGVDFPRLLLDCVAGRPPARAPAYRAGIRSRWFWGDVDALYLRLRYGDRALHLTPNGGRWSALRSFLAWHPGRDREEILRWWDPAPFLLETMERLLPGR